MSKRLAVINILWGIADTIMCVVVCALFGWGSWYFNKWWLLLFLLIPLALFQNHTLIIDADIEAAEKGEDDGASR